jgi:hypothetical protein
MNLRRTSWEQDQVVEAVLHSLVDRKQGAEWKKIPV